MRDNSRRLPKILIARLEKLLSKNKFYQTLRAFSEKRPATFRTNTLKITSSDLVERLENNGFKIKKVNWYKDAFIYSGSQRDLEKTDFYKNGFFYIQSLSSMIPPIILEPKPGEKILDITAAPGSKTTQIAGMMQNRGEIVANDVSKVRLEILKANLIKQGVNIVKTSNNDARNVWLENREYFDRTLADVTCSMEGTISSFDRNTYKGWSPENIKILSHKSKYILRSAVSSTRVGGRVVYSTCTLAPEENEEVIDWILEKEKNSLTVERIYVPGIVTDSGVLEWEGKRYSSQVANTVRIIPSELMEGFFIATLRKIKPTVEKL